MTDTPETPVTSFEEIFDFFYAGITDDMFLELTLEDTKEISEELLVAALDHFEFPRQDIFDIDRTEKKFNVKLSLEEMKIIREYMIYEWLGQQLASIDNVRQKYSGSDFKFTSQASHIKQLVALRDHYKDEGFHLQRLYCRRKKKESGGYGSTFAKIMEPPC